MMHKKMSKRSMTFSVYFLALLLGVVSLSILPVIGDPSATFKIEQTVWGTSVDNQIAVEPGDTNVPLTVNVRNRSNFRLNGIYATLYLNKSANGFYPFTNTTSGLEANAVGQALQVGNVFSPTGEVLPGTAFSLTFSLNINQDAKSGRYFYSMRIEYVVNQSNIILEGEPQILNVSIILPNRAPIIDSFTPMSTNPTVYVGDYLNFSVVSHDPDGDNLTYRWILDGTTVANATWFLYRPSDGDVGSHIAELRVSDGNLVTSQTWNVVVDKIRTTTISVSSNYLTGGLANPLNITVGNNLWKGTVEIQLNLPTQTPLVIYGNSSWTFRNIQPNSFVSVESKIYVPSSSIGATSTVQLTVSYGDEYGRSFTETHTIGLIVKGMINLTVYDVNVTPQPAYPGSAITITATLLNKGNIPATNVNISIQPNPVLKLSRTSSYYVDQIDKNSPEPFSVRADVLDTDEGVYPVALAISYMDDQLLEHTMNITTNIVVNEKTEGNTSQGEEEPFFAFLKNGGWTIITIIAVTVVITILYLRHTLKPIKRES